MNVPVSNNTTVLFVNSNKTLPAGCTIKIKPTIGDESSDFNQSHVLRYLLKYKDASLAIASCLLITLSIYLIKLSISLNAPEMAFFKNFIELILSLAFSYIYERSLFENLKESRIEIIIYCLANYTSIITLYFSIRLIDFTDSMSIRYLSSMIAIIFSSFLSLKNENFNTNSIVANVIVTILTSIFGLIGIICIIKPFFLFNSYDQTINYLDNTFYFNIGIFLAVISAFATALSFIFMKKLKNSDVHYCISNFYLSLTGIMISLILSFIFNSSSSWSLKQQFIYKDVSLALVSALISYIGKNILFKIVAELNSTKWAFLNITDLIGAFLIDVIVSKTFNPLTLIGSFFIFFSVLILIFFKYIMVKLKLDAYRLEFVE